MTKFTNSLKIKSLKIHCPPKADPPLADKLKIVNW